MDLEEPRHEDDTKPPVNAPSEAVHKEKLNPPADLEAGVRRDDTVEGELVQEEDTYLHGLPLITSKFDSLGDVGKLDPSIKAGSPNDGLSVAWYASAYLLTQMSFQPTFGKIYTFFNLKWVYLISSIIFEGGSILCAAAPSSAAFIIGRAIAGLGAAGIFCGAMIIISKIVEMKKRPLLLAIISSMYGIASVIGPSLGGVFTHSKQLTWRFCFWINLPLGAVMALIICFYYPLSLGEAPDNDHSLKEKILGLGLKSAVVLAGALGAMTTQSYHLPFYFQAVKGVGPKTSGVDILPHGVTVTVATLITGSIITWLGYYVPFMWAGSAIFTTGAGLLYTISQNTPTARWFGYEVLAGAGFGIAIQIPIFAVQVVLGAGDIPLGTVLIILSQALGGSVGLSISQNVFQNSLRQRLKTIADIDLQAVIAAGGTDLEHVVSADSLAYVRDAFRYGISNAFLVSTALGSVAFLASIGMERRRIKSKKEGGE
ncbi:HC-toxin efflux carrier TOXA [Fusarium napiforme]|uniref:HC-toxin efflux carrier TOXA n=1 Tax=Fusarium napiforme TaxID=42672 RepID=A0A8H5JQQ0_9HYPO|nr:HC-toxin efflux carrier TOXA [Fusarium napiforme]